MGQWTPDFMDVVLGSKIKNLVTGAITRLKLEGTDPSNPSITYDMFVKELETGDSFTTSLVDILVKELGERVKRPTQNQSDHRLIAESTAKALRMLATPLRIYHAADDDDDEFESMLEDATDGSRQPSELFDAYTTHAWPHTEARRYARSYSAIVANGNRSPSSPPLILPSLPSPPVTNRTGPWPLPLPGHSSLTRRQTIRRPPRASTSDFADFTSRRRSTIRDTHSARENSSTPELPVFPYETAPAIPSTSSASAASTNPRRFFPFHRFHRLSHPTPPFSDASDTTQPADAGEDTGLGIPDLVPSSSFNGGAPWLSFGLPPPDYVGSPEPLESPEDMPTPRLRRGGVRAPEAMLARHATPITILNPINVRISTSQTSDVEESGMDGVATYPTPGSLDSETVVQTSAS
ncbi:hypothetical protein HGRIS_010217 [Hohenbuehelia grisea]|uniref:Uncharacterized protein n=1 Tax=Hohenbuehelia grisea TaxID=104357 RepID=A0ABR3J482_9AGAR